MSVDSNIKLDNNKHINKAITPTTESRKMKNLNKLNELLKMLSAKMDFFMIKACAESAGFQFSSMSVPSLKNEIEAAIAHAEMECESETLIIS